MKDIYQEITDRFLIQLEKGNIPWQKPWRTPSNLVSMKPYKGVNALWLGSCSTYGSPYWLTYKQATDLGGVVKKGSKSEMVVYFKILDKKDKSGQPIINDRGEQQRIPLLKYSNVFNLEQCEGVESPAIAEITRDQSDCEWAKEIVEATPWLDLSHGGSRACYSPQLDTIKMPAMESFVSCSSYYHTLFHEMTHATGHKDRLARPGIVKFDNFGSEQYGQEELVAELGGAFLSNESGILSDVQFENSASYLSNWQAALSKDRKLIVSAASQAQKASNYILKNSPENKSTNQAEKILSE